MLTRLVYFYIKSTLAKNVVYEFLCGLVLLKRVYKNDSKKVVITSDYLKNSEMFRIITTILVFSEQKFDCIWHTKLFAHFFFFISVLKLRSVVWFVEFAHEKLALFNHKWT